MKQEILGIADPVVTKVSDDPFLDWNPGAEATVIDRQVSEVSRATSNKEPLIELKLEEHKSFDDDFFGVDPKPEPKADLMDIASPESDDLMQMHGGGSSWMHQPIHQPAFTPSPP